MSNVAESDRIVAALEEGRACPQCLHGWHGRRVCGDANCCSCRLTWRGSWKRGRAGVTQHVCCKCSAPGCCQPGCEVDDND